MSSTTEEVVYKMYDKTYEAFDEACDIFRKRKTIVDLSNWIEKQ